MNEDNDFLFLFLNFETVLRIQLQKNITASVRTDSLHRRFCLSSLIAGNSALWPFVVIDFAMILAGNSFIVRCHVTSKYSE